MANRVVQTVTFGRRMRLTAVAILAVAGPIFIGIWGQPVRAQSQQTRPSFEVTSVKSYKGDPRAMRPPQFLAGGRFTSRAPLLMVIAYAYNVPLGPAVMRISGGRSWINVASPEGVYDIEATAATDAIPDGLSPNARTERGRLLVRDLLADRFKLVIRQETKEMSVYALVVGKGGPKLQKADIQEKDCVDTPDSRPEDWNTTCHRFFGGRGRGVHGGAVDLSDLVNYVQGWTDRPLIDETGIKGLYHIETGPWLPMELGASNPAAGAKQDGIDVADLPTLFTVFERLGLKMQARKEQLAVYVIEHLEKPTAN
jgi:uncharacterized protein (TIGR03435 family)